MTKLKSFLMILALAVTFAGCKDQTDTSGNNGVASPTPAATPTPEMARTDYTPLTFPVLDAFFAEPQFSSDLKRDLRLTDDQVQQLQTAAREETARLREGTEDEYTGSTADARRLAEERINAIIGADKTPLLAEYVGKRWSSPSEDVALGSPSPTVSPLALPGVSPTEVPIASPSLSTTLNAPASASPSSTIAVNSAKIIGSPTLNTGKSMGANAANAANAAKTSPGMARSLSPKINVEPTDTRIVVNAPAYRMDLFRKGELIKSYRIGIGYPEFPLPTGKRAARSIIFNPTWTPPDEPWVEAPGAKVKVGEKVEAGDKRNPLGPIKIPIGLPSLIHGGKAPAKLGGFASHGCVGLTTPQIKDFSEMLAELSGTTLTEEQIDEYGKTPTETKSVKLTAPIPVDLRYETIVVEDGKLHIYRDVYDRGTNTEENLDAVLQAWGVSPTDLTEKERAQVEKALKQMALDARGHSTDQAAPEATPAQTAKGKAPVKDEQRVKLTRTVKGPKEMVIEIVALSGKGYPAPVDLDTGVQKRVPAKGKRRTAK